MPKRTHYFSPGPATLPDQVLEQIHSEFLDTFGIGVSIVEISHRSPEYEKLNAQTIELCRKVMQVPDTHAVLLSVCGAQQHFSLLIPHLSHVGDTISYTDTGIWAHLACEEAFASGRNVEVIYNGGPDYTHLGNPQSWNVSAHSKFVHITVNNTVYGTEYSKIPTFGHTPLVLDMTSALCARSDIPWEQTGLIYASAQKNFGVAGVSVIIMRKDLLEQSRTYVKKNLLGRALSYPAIYDAKSALNTPPVFAVYCLNRMLSWIDAQGGVSEMERRALEKARLVYDIVDQGFYKGRADKSCRSRHNFVFTLPSEEQCKHFIEQALVENIREIKGYKNIGGIRASMYNGVSVESARVFSQFMTYYRNKFS